VPLQDGVRELAAAARMDAWELGLGGEDYELLVAVAPERLPEATAAVAATGARLAVIGEALAGSGVVLSEPGGRTRRPSGFDQLRSRPEPGAPD
jgi:thiamine monophosphate kinase